MTDAPTRLRIFSTPCALGNSLCTAVHASRDGCSRGDVLRKPNRVFDEVFFSWFAGTSGVVTASPPASDVFLEATFLKNFGTGMSVLGEGERPAVPGERCQGIFALKFNECRFLGASEMRNDQWVGQWRKKRYCRKLLPSDQVKIRTIANNVNIGRCTR